MKKLFLAIFALTVSTSAMAVNCKTCECEIKKVKYYNNKLKNQIAYFPDAVPEPLPTMSKNCTTCGCQLKFQYDLNKELCRRRGVIRARINNGITGGGAGDCFE